jgi:gas vesicle protein
MRDTATGFREPVPEGREEAMHMSKDYPNGRGRTFLVGVLCGAAVGTAAGLLLAAKTGAELRRDLSARADRIGRRVSDTYVRAGRVAGRTVTVGRATFRKGRDQFTKVNEALTERTVGDSGDAHSETNANAY